jgi:hypothetical protein
MTTVRTRIYELEEVEGVRVRAYKIKGNRRLHSGQQGHLNAWPYRAKLPGAKPASALVTRFEAAQPGYGDGNIAIQTGARHEQNADGGGGKAS